MTDQTNLEKLSPDQLAALTDEQTATFLAMRSADQDFAASTFNPKDLVVFLARKREQMAEDKAAQARLEEIQARMDQAALEAAAPSSGGVGVKDVLGGVAGVAGVGAAVGLVSRMDPNSSWEVENPNRAITAAVSRLRGEFADQEKTDCDSERSGDVTHVTISLVRKNGRNDAWDRALIPALDVTLVANKAANRVEFKVGELEKETLLDAARALSKKGFNVLMKGARVLSRRGRKSAGEIFDLAGDSIDAAFDVGEALKDLNLEKQTWEVLGEVFDPLEKSYKDLLRKRAKIDAKNRELWNNYDNCPTCAVPFMADDVQCRVCDTARPPKPEVPDPRRKV
jgi:hypothetical protein